MKRVLVLFAIAIATVSLSVSGCSQAAPAPSPTQPPAAPTKAPEPAKAAQPTTAPVAQPTAVPAKKVDFPTKGKAITMLIPWGAGGGSDIVGRVLASMLETDLGTPVQVVNKAGAGTQVGLTEFVQAKPDGYTIALTNLPGTLYTYLDPERKAVYDRKNFLPLVQQGVDPGAVIVTAKSPFKTMKDVIDAAKAKPQSVKVGDAGQGSTGHAQVLLTEQAGGVKFTQVHFADGAAAALTALLGENIDVAFVYIGDAAAQIKSGTVRSLAVMDSKESPFAPGVKTMQSQGYNANLVLSRAFSLPAGTPKEIVDVLSASMKKVIESQDHVKKLQEMSVEARYVGPDDFAKYWDQQEAASRPMMDLFKQAQK